MILHVHHEQAGMQPDSLNPLAPSKMPITQRGLGSPSTPTLTRRLIIHAYSVERRGYHSRVCGMLETLAQLSRGGTSTAPSMASHSASASVSISAVPVTRMAGCSFFFASFSVRWCCARMARRSIVRPVIQASDSQLSAHPQSAKSA